MEPKYELTTDSIVNDWGFELYRIKALVDIPETSVKAGDTGGYLRSIYLGDGSPRLSGNAWVFDNAQVFENAQVSGNAMVSGNAQLSGHAMVSGNAMVYGNAQVYSNAQVYDNALVRGSVQVRGHAQVSGHALVYGNALVCGEARVSGKAELSGEARVSGDALIEEKSHCLVVDPIGSEGVKAVLFRTRNGKSHLSVGCWQGTTNKLMAEVRRRRKNWKADKAKQELWVAQYKALHALCKATSAQW